MADVAALGSILIPGMKAKGYPGPFAAAVMSSSATLAVIIPPSIPMILYAVMAETSVVQMFVAGIVPGILGAIGLMGMATFLARRYNLPREEAFSVKRVGKTGREALWAFALPIIILGGIFGGVVTATEGAALAVLAALFIGLVVYRELDLKHLRAAIMEGGVQTAVVMLLVATSALLGTYLTEVQAPQALAKAVSKPRLVFLFGPVGERLIGLVCLALALVLILPIPGGNILPAMAVSALAFALIQRDGLIALIGYGLAITSASVLALAAHIIVRMFLHAWTVVTAA